MKISVTDKGVYFNRKKKSIKWLAKELNISELMINQRLKALPHAKMIEWLEDMLYLSSIGAAYNAHVTRLSDGGRTCVKELVDLTGISTPTAQKRLTQYNRGQLEEYKLFLPAGNSKNTLKFSDIGSYNLGPRKSIDSIPVGTWEKELPDASNGMLIERGRTFMSEKGVGYYGD